MMLMMMAMISSLNELNNHTIVYFPPRVQTVSA